MQLGKLQDKYQIKDPKPPILHFLSEPLFYSFPNAYDYIKEKDLKCKLCQLYKTLRIERLSSTILVHINVYS